MFNLKVKFLLAVSILIVGGVSAASAQLVDGTSLKFSVASSFVLNDKTFPAGTYTVARTPSTIDSPTLMIIRGDNGQSMIFDTMTARSTKLVKNTELVFDYVDGVSVLTQIRLEGEKDAIEIPSPRSTSPAQHVTFTDTGL